MTPATDRILHYIARYRGDYECGPSIRDISRACGVRSTSHVHYALAQLRAADVVDWHELPGGAMMPRSVYVTADGRNVLEREAVGGMMRSYHYVRLMVLHALECEYNKREWDRMYEDQKRHNSLAFVVHGESFNSSWGYRDRNKIGEAVAPASYDYAWLEDEE